MTDAAPTPTDSSDRGTRSPRPWSLLIALAVSGVAGVWAAFALTLDKFEVLQAQIDGTQVSLDCNVSVIVQCQANLESWQGSVFFHVPNPVWGLLGWAATIVVAAALLAGARFQRWFWLLFNLGHAAALAFCIWLMSQSIFIIGTLCPWCMVTWAAAILSFWVLTLHNLREGRFGAWGRRAGAVLYGWWPLITILSYLVVAAIAQLRLEFIGTL